MSSRYCISIAVLVKHPVWQYILFAYNSYLLPTVICYVNMLQASNVTLLGLWQAFHHEEFVLVASSTAPLLVDPEGADSEPEVQGVPLVASTTLYLVCSAAPPLCRSDSL